LALHVLLRSKRYRWDLPTRNHETILIVSVWFADGGDFRSYRIPRKSQRRSPKRPVLYRLSRHFSALLRTVIEQNNPCRVGKVTVLVCPKKIRRNHSCQAKMPAPAPQETNRPAKRILYERPLSLFATGAAAALIFPDFMRARGRVGHNERPPSCL